MYWPNRASQYCHVTTWINHAPSCRHTICFSAACALKLSDPEDVLRRCDAALAIQPDNSKALFRRAQAHRARKDYDLARVNMQYNQLSIIGILDYPPPSLSAIKPIETDFRYPKSSRFSALFDYPPPSIIRPQLSDPGGGG